jgi:hypothetical protein
VVVSRSVLPDALIQRLDWKAALKETISPRGEFFPSRVEANAASLNEEQSLKRLLGRLRKGLGLARAEVVAVPRRGLLTAPARDVPFLDRVVMTALALSLVSALEDDAEALALDLSLDGLRENARRSFEQTPLDRPTAQSLVISDVAAFYDYVDQDLLAVEIAELTGDVDLADATSGVLSSLVGGSVGVPAGPRSADVFADFFLSDVDRRLLRAGVHASRLRDEYLVTAADRSGALRSLRVLERALWERRLVLNSGKTRLLSREAYEEGLLTKQSRMASAAIASDPDIAIYGFDPEAFLDLDWSDLNVEHAEAIFDEALQADGVDFGGFGEGEIARGLIALGACQSMRPLAHLERLVDEHPGLSREISFYLRQLKGSDHEQAAVEASVQILTRDGFVHSFTEGWLLDFLARTDDEFPAGFHEKLARVLVDESRPWFVRGRAAIALARERVLPAQDDMDDLFARAPEPTRADLAAAVELGQPAWRSDFRKGYAAAGPLLRFVPALIDEQGVEAV